MSKTRTLQWDDHGRVYSMWDLDPILAIGGCKHGLALPKSTHMFGDLTVMKPIDMHAVLFTEPPDPLEPPTLDSEIERYRRHKLSMPSSERHVDAHIFPVYVEATFDMDEALTWVKLLALSLHILRTLAITGLLTYLVAAQQLQQDTARFEHWAGMQRQLHRLRDELDGLG